MSEQDYVDQFIELIRLSELNEAEAVLLIMELNGIPMRSYVYKHDTQTGNTFLDRYNVLFGEFKEWVLKQEELEIQKIKEAKANE